MNSLQIPVARKEGLVIQEMSDEVLVYDLDTNKAHCLNQTAATVWKSCDGNNSIADISKLFGSQSGKTVDEDFIWLAIDQLNEKNLLAQETVTKYSGENRREIIKKVGLAAVVALPLVTSLVAPKSVSAQSRCVNPGCLCTLNMGTCTTQGGCLCNAFHGTNDCPSICTGGCAPCMVPQGAPHCNSTCS